MHSSVFKENKISEPGSHSEPINLNEIVQLVLQRLQQANKSLDIIARCETLPLVYGEKKNIVRVFNDIVQMIVSHPINGPRLFLYVDCEEENNETLRNEFMKTYKRYKLNFHTNISTNEAWKTAHEETIAGCRILLAQYGASFTVKEIKSAGCLFSISLPGKM